jgi:hypothetical protein
VNFTKKGMGKCLEGDFGNPQHIKTFWKLIWEFNNKEKRLEKN